jgi:hypothetical protein
MSERFYVTLDGNAEWVDILRIESGAATPVASIRARMGSLSTYELAELLRSVLNGNKRA